MCRRVAYVLETPAFSSASLFRIMEHVYVFLVFLGEQKENHRECGEQLGFVTRIVLCAAPGGAATSLGLVWEGQNSRLREQGFLDVVSNHWFGGWLWLHQNGLFSTQNGPLPTQLSWSGIREGIFPATSLLEERTLTEISLCCLCSLLSLHFLFFFVVQGLNNSLCTLLGKFFSSLPNISHSQNPSSVVCLIFGEEKGLFESRWGQALGKTSRNEKLILPLYTAWQEHWWEGCEDTGQKGHKNDPARKNKPCSWSHQLSKFIREKAEEVT